MPTFGIDYAVGVDGVSLLLVLLTTFLPPLCVLGSWDSITSRLKAFMMLILLVQGAMMVVFTALDAFLFFMLWEVTMIPMYFMIVLWGGPGRIAAGLKFVLYSLTGSLLLLVGILGLSLQAGTFDIQSLADHGVLARARSFGFFSRCSWASRSSCRCCRFTHGCQTRTRRRRRPAVCCWRAYC